MKTTPAFAPDVQQLLLGAVAAGIDAATGAVWVLVWVLVLVTLRHAIPLAFFIAYCCSSKERQNTMDSAMRAWRGRE